MHHRRRNPQTTGRGCALSVVQEHLLLNCLCSGTCKRQRWVRCLPGRRDIPVPIRNHIETGRKNRDREVSPTGPSLASRPGGLFYRDIARIEERDGAPTARMEKEIETGRSLLLGKERAIRLDKLTTSPFLSPCSKTDSADRSEWGRRR